MTNRPKFFDISTVYATPMERHLKEAMREHEKFWGGPDMGLMDVFLEPEPDYTPWERIIDPTKRMEMRSLCEIQDDIDAQLIRHMMGAHEAGLLGAAEFDLDLIEPVTEWDASEVCSMYWRSIMDFTTLRPFRTVTGRWKSSSPNFNTLPRPFKI